jgi:hypothetical protein
MKIAVILGTRPEIIDVPDNSRALKGKIVLVPFLFTDLAATKLRPALVLAPTVHGRVLAHV